MIKQVRRTINYWSKRRRLFQVRRAFERAGYPVDHFSDSQIEAALTRGERSIEEVPISAKILSLALRRLSKRKGDAFFNGPKSPPTPERRGAGAAAS